ncbi:Dolichyl-diphosphooligosaccharide--protein glycosyltransferase subunit 3 [Candida viswanathii]|uniref:Dolichyl-diphosphooligosaccharide--protein glycosyltransferase subunit 3 n=1 Tax=Candida viswanathii TaxID=5486 RepID=A0A367YH70_9ASCO|nr:Dolichyl-diphosphooligosaccharide--protein glycosyltransferase subunit 3 [Candida viswanathii]
MRYSILLFITSLWALVLGGLTNDELLSIVKHNKRKLIPLNDQNFESVLNGKRDYHIVALLTSESPNINCVLCREIGPELGIIADSWFKDHPNGLTEQEMHVEDEDGEEQPPLKNIYFFKSEFLESKKLFGILKLQNIPKLFYFPPTEALGPNNYLNEMVEYQFFQGDHKDLMKNWFSGLTNHHFNLYIPLNKAKLALNFVGAFVFVILTKVFSKQIKNFITSKVIWCAGSLIAVLLFTTGYMFNQIRAVPYLNERRDGTVEYFAPGQQSQFGVETQILSFIYGLLSILVIVLIKRVPEVKTDSVNLLLVVILSSFIFVMFSLLLSIFGGKAHGFPYRFINFF